MSDIEIFDDPLLENSSADGNPNLRPLGIPVRFTPSQLEEYNRCSEDPIYFINNYINIISLDEGIVKFKTRPYQDKMIRLIDENRFIAILCARQAGKTISVVSYFVWCILFKPNYSVGILANKESQAKVILSRLAMAYENLPKWIQQGVKTWNKLSIELENGSAVITGASSASASRGNSLNALMLDEFAFLPYAQQHAFYASVYPIITSGTKTKLVMISTPHGRELFHKIWMDSIAGKNSFKHMKITWDQVPGRDEAWKEETIKNTSLLQFKAEQMCEFEGSVDTLIPVSDLLNQPQRDPIRKTKFFTVFDEPIPEHVYFLVADTSRGVSGDYSAFVVFDITKLPYKVVATYSDNTVKPDQYPFFIEKAAAFYNDAYVLAEDNDAGIDVISHLVSEHEVPNLLSTGNNGRAGQKLGEGIELKFGVSTTAPVKRVGCLSLRSLVEHSKIEIVSEAIIDELYSFIRVKNSYEAEKGHHDDFAMCCVLFAWASTQEYFKGLVHEDDEVWQKIREESAEEIEEASEKGLGKVIERELSTRIVEEDNRSYMDRLLDEMENSSDRSMFSYSLADLIRNAQDHF